MMAAEKMIGDAAKGTEMNCKRESVETVLVIWGVALILLFAVAGCGREEEPMTQQPPVEQTMGQAEEAVGGAQEAVTAAIEQKTCPVMENNPINPNMFVEYEGKKVYFCCPGCPEKFKADPEKYLSKLPQFQQ